MFVYYYYYYYYYYVLSQVGPPECEAGHVPPFSSEVRNEWSYTSTPPRCLFGVNRENFIFFTYYYYGSPSSYIICLQ
jgi:hypothetical protein